MISTRKAALALLLALAACGGGAQGTAPGDWRGALRRGDGVAAEIALKRALAAGRPAAELAPFLGEAALRRGDLGEARAWLEKVQFAPGVAAHGFHMLGRLRLREGDLAAAGHAFDQALAKAPDNPELWVDIARLRYQGGEHAQAVQAARKALALGPSDAAALLLSAQLARDAGGNLAALPLFERGLRASPGDPDLLADYAATLGELGRAREMLAATRKFAAAAPGDPRALYLQAVLAARAGKADLARGLLQRSGNLDRQMPAAALLLALLDLGDDNPASAAQGLDRLLAAQPDNLRLQGLLARALAGAGNNRELIARFGGNTDDRGIALLVGRAYESLGERGKAAAYLDRAMQVRRPRLQPLAPSSPLVVTSLRGPADGAAAVALVRGLIAGKRAGEASSAARRWLRLHPGSADAMALAGDAALAAGDARGALAQYRKAAAIRCPWPLAKRMAAALEAGGDLTAAETIVAEQLASEPGNGESAAMLADRYAARGERERAALLAAHAAAYGG